MKISLSVCLLDYDVYLSLPVAYSFLYLLLNDIVHHLCCDDT